MSKSDAKLYRLETSRYDRVAGLLLALLTLLGAIVLIMLLVWLTNRIFASQAAVPVTMEEIGTDEDPWGPGNDIEPPGPEETDLVEEEIEETLDAVADAVATKAAMLEPRLSGSGTGRGGGGTGRGRRGVPRRWEVIFDKGMSLTAYARQLDAFGIELGVLRAENRVEYAYHLAQPKPSSRKGAANADKRYFLAWKRGELEEADRELLERAGIQIAGGTVLKFLPAETEQKMLALEQAVAAGRPVRSTVFGVRPGNKDPFEFYVIRQTYR